MKRFIMEQLLHALNELPDVSRSEYYFLMASVLVYFQSPLKEEPWNTFPARLENREWSVPQALLFTDEEKNPHYWSDSRIPKRTKESVAQQIFEQLVRLRKRLEKNYPYPHTSPSLVTVPAPPLRANEPPTIFPAHYLHNQFKSGKYVNELTGDPLSWTFVEQVKNNNVAAPRSHPRRLVPTEKFLEEALREIRALQYNRGHCQICRKKSTVLKSIWNYRTVEFCSLDCLRNWGMN